MKGFSGLSNVILCRANKKIVLDPWIESRIPNTRQSSRMARFSFKRGAVNVTGTLRIIVIAELLVSCVLFDQCQASSSQFKGTVFQFTHELTLSSGGIKVRWTLKDPEWITFEMSSPTKGYIGVGFSHSGSMAGSDLYIGWVDSGGNAHIKDYHATENGAPVLDQQQDLELLAASENEHGTMIVFRRKRDTCDHRDYVIGDDTVFLIWAWGNEDPTPTSSQQENDFHLSYHGNSEQSRGARGIRMTSMQVHWKFPDEEEKYPFGVQQYDFVNTNVQVPKADSYHHCRVIKFPQLYQRQNILAYRSLLTSETADQIHQILLHKCDIPKDGSSYVSENDEESESILEKYVDLPGWNCYSQAYPLELKAYCSHSTIAILGKGYEGFKYPDHVGVEIGDVTGSSYYRLEIHYQNPDGLYTIDNSGIRIFYSPTIREYEAGILTVGHRKSPFMTIPPHQAEFNIYGVCSAECMRNGLNPEGTKVIAVQMHTHSPAGKRAQLKHIRNGKELPPIMVDHYLNPYHQDYRLLPREVKILPDDQLIMQCTYETIGSDDILFGGLSRHEEACEAILVYYPKSRLTDCKSQPELYQYLGAFGVINATGETFRKLNVSYSPESFQDEYTPVDDAYILEEEGGSQPAFNDVLITSPSTLKNRYLYDYLSRLNWGNDFLSKIVEQKWKTGLHFQHCTGNGRRKIHTSSHVVPYPIYEDYMFPAQEPEKCFNWRVGNRAESSITKSSNVLRLVILFSVVYVIR